MTGQSWNRDRAQANAAAGVADIMTLPALPGLLPALPALPAIAIGQANGRPCWMQEDGRPLMYIDDAQELC